MKKTIITLAILTSGGVFANEQCYDIIPDGPLQELDTPTISMLGSNDIYANGVMQAQIKVGYEATVGFSLNSITLCDSYTKVPLEEEQEWEVSQQSNGYLHDMHSSSSQVQQEQFFTSDWNSQDEVRYLNKVNDTPISIEVCAVVSGTQSNEKTIAKTTCIGKDVSSVKINALDTPVIEFELVKNKFKDTDNHSAFTYELHTKNIDANFRKIKYGTGVKLATDPTLYVVSNSNHTVLRDTQYNDKISSWIGVWAYDPAKVRTVKMINENSGTVGSYSIAPVDKTPSLVSTYLLHQIHKKDYMVNDYLCPGDIGGAPDFCSNYSQWGTKLSPQSDRLSNSVTLTDNYGTEHSISLTFGAGDDNDDLFIGH